MDFTLARTFLEIVTAGSFLRASERLPNTASQAVAQLIRQRVVGRHVQRIIASGKRPPTASFADAGTAIERVLAAGV